MGDGQGGCIDHGVAGRALDGVHCGDVAVVVPSARGVLLALMDGLGHGPEAAAAAGAAAAAIADHAADPLGEVMRRCHERLRGTRGVALTLAQVDPVASTLTWAGVGNVDAVLLRSACPGAREAVPLRGGIVGYQLPPLRPTVVALEPGDLLVLATDGVQSDCMAGVPLEGTPQAIAATLLARYGKAHDDAMVLAARYLGGGDR